MRAALHIYVGNYALMPAVRKHLNKVGLPSMSDNVPQWRLVHISSQRGIATET
jgi:hypothetical protein